MHNFIFYFFRPLIDFSESLREREKKPQGWAILHLLKNIMFPPKGLLSKMVNSLILNVPVPQDCNSFVTFLNEF